MSSSLFLVSAFAILAGSWSFDRYLKHREKVHRKKIASEEFIHMTRMLEGANARRSQDMHHILQVVQRIDQEKLRK